MRNDVFQTAIMFVGMMIILMVTYAYFGGVTTKNSALDGL